MMPDKGVPIKAWTKGCPAGGRRASAVAERRAVAVHLQVGGRPCRHQINRTRKTRDDLAGATAGWS